MILQIELALDPEEVLGVAEMGVEAIGHLVGRGQKARVGGLPCPRYGIRRVKQVEGHIPVVCVDDGLDRISHVVDAGAKGRRLGKSANRLPGEGL